MEQESPEEAWRRGEIMMRNEVCVWLAEAGHVVLANKVGRIEPGRYIPPVKPYGPPQRAG